MAAAFNSISPWGRTAADLGLLDQSHLHLEAMSVIIITGFVGAKNGFVDPLVWGKRATASNGVSVKIREFDATI
jgi:hypothetical protein